ncbi:MAG: hypothetical protein AAGD13_25135 [Pseudomonadota bacterium]
MSERENSPETVADTDLDSAQGGLVLNLSVGVKDAEEPQAEASTNTHRFDPYKNFNFRV